MMPLGHPRRLGAVAVSSAAAAYGRAAADGRVVDCGVEALRCAMIPGTREGIGKRQSTHGCWRRGAPRGPRAPETKRMERLSARDKPREA